MVTVYTKPEAVNSLTVTEVTTSSLFVNWTKPKGSSSFYRVQWKGGEINDQRNVSETSLTISNLTAGEQYTITVTAVAADKLTEGKSEIALKYTRPNSVTGLTKTEITTSSVTLKWNQTNSKPPYLYEVQLESESQPKVVNTTTFTFDSLKSGSKYTFTVTTMTEDYTRAESVTVFYYTRPYNITVLNAFTLSTTAIYLNWTRPYEYKDDFKYWVETTGCHNQNTSSKGESVTFSGLTSGTNCSFCVTVMAEDGTEGKETCTTQYTQPQVALLNIANEGSNNSVLVSWTNLPGNVEKYDLHLNCSSSPNQTATPIEKRSFNNTYRFYNLHAAELCSAVMISNSGTFKVPSEIVTTATYPNPPGNIDIQKQTTSSIELQWGKAPDMEYAFNYSYKLTYNRSLNDIKIPSIKTNYNFSQLLSGTSYNISVTTVGPMNFESKSVYIYVTTRPHNVKSVTLDPGEEHINLNWILPDEYKETYRFFVAWQSHDGAYPTNTTSNKTSYNITGLTPGTNYNIFIITKTSDGTESATEKMSGCTKPQVALLNISNEGSNNSVLVSWTNPRGNVEKYDLHLNCSSSPNQTATPIEKRSFNNTYRFYNLHAAELCSAVMISNSGTFKVPSEIVTTATYPNPPGNIDIQKQTTSSIELQWGKAPDMEYAFNYSYKLTFNRSLDDIKIPSDKTNYSLSQLPSGTSYNISVTTVGPMYFESKSVYIYVTTRPHNVKSVTLDPGEEHINLNWTQPDEYKETYRFFVAWQSRDWAYPTNTTSNKTLYNITGLTPGTNYNIFIITKTSDGTESATEKMSGCTNASPVNNLRCDGPNSGDAKLILNWNEPKGKYYNFKFTVTNTSTLSYTNSFEHIISNLTYHSTYSITVETQSCGNSSPPQWITCQTGVTKPPIPSDFAKQVSKTHTTFTLQVKTDLISNSKGPVTHVGILVTSDDSAKIPDIENFLAKTYSEWKSKSAIAYLATVMNYTQTFLRSSTPLDFEIGKGSTWEGYANDPLDPSGSYRYAVVVCTYLVVDSRRIDTSKSVCSISDLSTVIILDKDPAITYIAVGVTLGIFGFLFVILIGFIIYWRRLSRKESPDIQIQSMGGKVSVAVRVEDFEAYYRKQKADSSCGFAEEFEDLKPVGTAQAKLHALALENKPKNRYNNVLPYDSSRVKLSVVHGSPNEDYINANYMPGYLSRKEYIAAQGPLPATVNEFWRMVWEKNVQTLVMLTRCNEQGRVKCEQYWSSGTKHCEDIIVTTTSEIQLEDWTIRDFDIKNVKTTEVRSVRHFHFTAWPDHGVPETTELLISFRHLVREHMNQYSRNSPTVVHCSAGVGRTGTFIAIDRLIFQIERENTVDVYGIVHDLRMHRPLMVQTEDQYVFLNQCALDIIRARTGNNVDLIYQNTAAISIYENVEPKRGY
ncbi:receptor-type tyrosine-protein phosphatase eta isoform X2 [Gambusia affinis]|uniref:receptor-type tyrosine-protein phosphatase eta isoform X2 n=1 Tax=Gambusia affinis TaxID=33528 RepID=UPI001CDC0889|nr:receptor-type tyrosine-protein phosphatase eta isoform X2 [Gambusia affinis]